jgi:imidazolonepropionase-like amidohydrolase
MERWELPTAVTGPTDSGRRLWVENGLLTADAVTGAERLPGSFALPGLVDSHFHMAFGYGAVPLSREETFGNLRAAVLQGVLLVRDMGAPAGISLNLPAEPDFPRVIPSGQHLAIPGGFIEGSHDPVPPERLVEVALAEVARGAKWVKIMADSEPDAPPSYPMEVVRRMASAVHARGARVAAHTEHAAVHELVHNSVDSIEHGSAMTQETLRVMATLGIAWAPTTNLYLRDLEEMDAMLARPDLEPDRRTTIETIYRPHVVAVLANIQALLAVAARLGVRLLASTDIIGTVAEDVERFVASGVDPAVAVGAATWDARRYLGAPGLDEGAPADVVTFDYDPRVDPGVLSSPRAILLGGRRIH